MNLSRNFTLQELIKSDTAVRKGIDNNPNSDQIAKLKLELSVAIGSSINSQHCDAEAVDFECPTVDNAELCDWIYKNLEYDQMILEFYKKGEPSSGWCHCSYVENKPRKQFLHAFKEDGKTKYKPIIGKAVDLI